MQKLPDKSIDLIVTDPPYLMSYRGNRQDKEHKFNKVILNDDNEQIIIDYMKQCSRVLKDDSAIYMFCNSNRVEFFKIEIGKIPFRNTCSGKKYKVFRNPSCFVRKNVARQKLFTK